jgi:hypothetical protein
VAKCAALLQRRVSVVIVDLVTTRHFNLYGELLELLEQSDPALAPEPPGTYAVACRWTHPGTPLVVHFTINGRVTNSWMQSLCWEFRR